jgi:hypothetical protein
MGKVLPLIPSPTQKISENETLKKKTLPKKCNGLRFPPQCVARRVVTSPRHFASAFPAVRAREVSRDLMSLL